MSSEKKTAKQNPVVAYVDNSYQELRRVTWPTKNRAIRLTFLVLGVCLVVAIFLGILDFVFGTGYRSLLDLGPQRSLPATTEVTTPPAAEGEEGLSVGDISITDSEGNVTTTEGTITPPPSEGGESGSSE